jgi:hypothetical protein
MRVRSDRKTAGEIEDLLKDLRNAFIESALEGELRRLLGLRVTVSLDGRWLQGSGPSTF